MLKIEKLVFFYHCQQRTHRFDDDADDKAVDNPKLLVEERDKRKAAFEKLVAIMATSVAMLMTLISIDNGKDDYENLSY